MGKLTGDIQKTSEFAVRLASLGLSYTQAGQAGFELTHLLPVSSIAELELTHLVAAPRPFRQPQARSDFVSSCCSPRRLPAGDGS